MVGIGAVIAGGLQGLGAGIAQSGQMAAEERRQVALERLRQQHNVEMAGVQSGLRREEMGVQADANIRVDKAQTTNADWMDARRTARGTASQVTVDNNRGKIEAQRDARTFEQQKQLKSIDLANDLERDRFRAAVGQQAAQFEQQLRSGEIQDIKEGGDGTYWAVNRDGSTRSLGIRTPVESEGALLSSSGARPSGGIGAGQPAPAAAAPAVAPRAQSPRPAQKPDAQAPKTYTMAEAQQTAKARGVSIEQVHRVMREAGYKLTK